MAQFRAEKAGINAEVQQKVRSMPLLQGENIILKKSTFHSVFCFENDSIKIVIELVLSLDNM